MHTRHALIPLALLAGFAACGTSNQTPGTPSGGDDSGAAASGSSGGSGTSGGGAGSPDATGSSSGSSSGGGGDSGSTAHEGGSTPDGGYGSSGDGGSCSSALSGRVRVTEVDVGVTVSYSEVDTPLTPLAISPIAGGGSRVGFMSTDGHAHVVTLDAQDHLVAGSALGVTASDFQDLYADPSGGVMLVSRPSAAAGTLNCGTPANLCGTPPSPAIPCFDLYMVRFDGASETWAAKLTQSDASHPPYLTSATDPNNIIFIWWYAHNGRIASDGTNWAAYFGAAISVSQSGCVNIHQGDRMQIVNPQGTVQSGGFGWGCSHSGYERIVWDPSASKYVTVCKNDAPTGGKSGRLAFAPTTTTIDPVDLNYSDLGSILPASGGGYWIVTSDIRPGQTANANGLADVHLLHVANTSAPTPDKDIVLASDSGLNDRGPHLAAYGSGLMIAAWDTSTTAGDLDTRSANRTFEVQVLDRMTGSPPSGSSATTAGPLAVPVVGSRYQDFRSYTDGSVAYVAPGSSSTKIKVLRVLACN
jgi:hypothetical protein